METGGLTLSNQSLQVVADRRWLTSTPVSKKGWSEPVKEEFLEVKDGSHRAILRQWRDRIEEPLQREVFRGWIDIRLVGIIPPSKEVKKALEREGILSEDEMAEFIVLFRASFDVNRKLVENAMMAEKGEVMESNHPLVAFFRVQEDEVLRSILYNINLLFPTKKEALSEFVEKNREELMTVKVVRKFKIYRGN